MARVSERDLDRIVEKLNKITNSPSTTYTRDKYHKYTANVGNYHLDWAYGGVSLKRVMCEAGSVEDVLGCGFVTKRDLYGRIVAYMRGYQDGV